jgi:predicted dehydrogenase
VIRIGVVGLGFLGRMHFGAYEKIDGVELVAVCDGDPKRRGGDLTGGWGNIEGGVDHLDMTRVTGVSTWQEMAALDNVDIVDVCVPTAGHSEVVCGVLETGKHVICEKPLASNSEEAARIAAAVDQAKGFFMPAMVMRFWPEWQWLKDAVEKNTYGNVIGASFTRLGNAPAGWYRDGKLSGGAMIDLHIHDIDFVCHLLGVPDAVDSRGHVDPAQNFDHVVTRYIYDSADAPNLVTAEGGWLGDDYPFSMRFVVTFEKAMADFNIARKDPLILISDGENEAISCEGVDGYVGELAYFADCVRDGRKPERVTAQEAVDGLRVAEAEIRSIQSHQIERVAK